MLKKLFKKRTAKEIPAPPDGKFYGNTSELSKSIDHSMLCATAETFGVDPDELSEEETEDFVNLGWVLYWIARGFHVSTEDLERIGL